MKTLCIDTSSKLCSVAILEEKNLIEKIEINNGLTHSETLMPIIKQILEKNKLSLSTIDLLVCDIGPGSFTGIRIGIATVKAFSDSLNIPCIGVSSLECLAYNIKNDGIICSMIDCKNNNCYYAVYKLVDEKYDLLEAPKSDSVENCLKLLDLKYNNDLITFVGDASLIYKEYIQNNFNNYLFADDKLNNIDTYSLGIAGINKYEKNNKLEPILPLYLKKPQAQRQFESKNIQIQDMNFSDLDNLNFSDFDDFWNINILKDELSSPNSKFFVAKLDNKIIGFAGIKTILDETNIMNIAVSKNYRRQGIATLLLKYIIEFCKENNILTITLEVNEKNLAALSLYQKVGFKECGKRKKYYNNTFDAILMNLLIPAKENKSAKGDVLFWQFF